MAADTDGFVATVRGNQGGTWAHWQLALPYARYSPPPSISAATPSSGPPSRGPGGLSATGDDPVQAQLAQQLQQLHHRLDALERHAADLMLLQLSVPDLLLGDRREFSARSQAIIIEATTAAPFEGQCPCCG